MLTSADVLFVVNGAASVAERSLLQHRTWCRSMKCVFVSDVAFPVDEGIYSL